MAMGSNGRESPAAPGKTRIKALQDRHLVHVAHGVESG
jgi:hypothetical protein